MTGRASCSAIANVPPRNYGRLLLDQRREKKKSWKMVMWHAWERERARSGVWQTLSARGKHGWKDCCVISFGNLTIERRTLEERKLHTLRKVKLKKKKFLFSRSPCCCLKLVCPSFPNKIWNLLFHERYSNGKMLERKENWYAVVIFDEWSRVVYSLLCSVSVETPSETSGE